MNKQNIKASYFSTIKIPVLNTTKLRNTTQKRRPDISYEDFVEVGWRLQTRIEWGQQGLPYEYGVVL
jgi:hypothetical protein